MLVALLAGMQMTAFATVATTQNTEVSRRADEVSSLPGTPRTATDTNAVSRNEADRLNNVTEADINPISANPQTGADSLAVPAALALLAASTAAIALSTKKRGK